MKEKLYQVCKDFDGETLTIMPAVSKEIANKALKLLKQNSKKENYFLRKVEK